MRDSITGTTTKRGHLVLLDVVQHRGRLEPAAQHQRGAEQHRDGARAGSPARGTSAPAATSPRRTLNGTCDSMPPIGASVGGRAAVGALGGAGGAAGQDDDRGVLGGLRRRIALLLRAIRSASVSSVLPDGSSLSGLVASARSLPSGGSACRHGLGVLVVVDDQLGAFALGDLLDLRAGELAVEQDQPGADLRGAVVARSGTSGGCGPGSPPRRRRGPPSPAGRWRPRWRRRRVP